MIGRKKRRYKRHRNIPALEPESWQLSSETKKTIIIIVIFTFALLGIISLFNGAGALGEWIHWGLGQLFGWANWIVLLLLLVLDYFLLFDEKYSFKKINYFGLALLWLSLTGLFDYLVNDETLKEITAGGRGGGYLGYFIGHNLSYVAGFWGGLIILLGALFISIFIFFNTSFRQILERVKDFQEGLGHGDHETIYNQVGEEPVAEENYSEVEEEIEEPAQEIGDNKQIAGAISEETKRETGRTYKRVKRIEIPLDLLNSATSKPTSGDIKINSLKIEKTLENFGIDVTMAEITVGPTVTQYTFKPAEGVKLSKITALQNDISLALAAHPIRIEAPIPGKSLVGIEVPNVTPSLVRLREVISSDVFKENKNDLVITLGKDVTGKSVVADLGKMPHLLIAGATGSGKSVAINSIIISLLWKNSSSDLKIILVDPKRVELTSYNDIPHLYTPVITDVKTTINTLRGVVNEMDDRYKLLASAGKKNITSYNSALLLNKMPYIVVVIDELADLMAVAARDVEAAIVRLAQMARAVGIHLILATQRPSVNVITGQIKANITSRVAFAVASQIDSRTILDTSGAEKLLGNGDMLYISAELSKPKRIQGAFVSETEVSAVTDYLKAKGGKPDYNMEISEPKGHSGLAGQFEDDQDDEELGIATDIIVKSGRASATLLQSRMRIGFAKAARLLELLEDRGIVGPSQGAKPREVLVTAEDLANNFDPRSEAEDQMDNNQSLAEDDQYTDQPLADDEQDDTEKDQYTDRSEAEDQPDDDQSMADDRPLDEEDKF